MDAIQLERAVTVLSQTPFFSVDHEGLETDYEITCNADRVPFLESKQSKYTAKLSDLLSGETTVNSCDVMDLSARLETLRRLLSEGRARLFSVLTAVGRGKGTVTEAFFIVAAYNCEKEGDLISSGNAE